MLPTVKNWGLAFVIHRSQPTAKHDRERTLADFIDFVNSNGKTKLPIIGSVRLYGYFYGRERKPGKTYREDGAFSHSSDIKTIEKDGDNYIIATGFGNFSVNKNDFNRDMMRMLDDYKHGKLSDLHGVYLFDYDDEVERKIYL